MGARTEVKEWLVAHELPHDSALDREIGGVKLLLAYALDKEPKAGSVGHLPAAMVADGRLKLAFPALRTDVIYRAEASEDMVDWSDEGVTMVPLADGKRLEASIPLGNGRRFLRLVVEQ